MEIIQTNTKIKQLNEFGQSIWLDNISRPLINSGELSRLIDLGVSGVTSNPTIFDKAISSSDYDQRIKQLRDKGMSTFDIYDELTVSDIKDAADLFMPIFIDSKGIDGYVSLEVNPLLAYNTQETIKEAQRLHKKLNKPNIMFKVPATENGFQAGKALLSEGINVNFTLIFSLEQYIKAADAYLKGAEELFNKGKDLKDICSVASVFVSRIDTLIDSLIDIKLNQQSGVLEKEALQNLYGKAAVANSKLIYKRFLDIFFQEIFIKLEEKGLKKQRIVWASTSTKNPKYNSLKYVTELIGEFTINTMPQSTIDIFINEGAANSVLALGVRESQEIIGIFKKHSIDMQEICTKLLTDGVKAFQNSFYSLLKAIESKQQEV